MSSPYCKRQPIWTQQNDCGKPDSRYAEIARAAYEAAEKHSPTGERYQYYANGVQSAVWVFETFAIKLSRIEPDEYCRGWHWSYSKRPFDCPNFASGAIEQDGLKVRWSVVPRVDKIDATEYQSFCAQIRDLGYRLDDMRMEQCGKWGNRVVLVDYECVYR